MHGRLPLGASDSPDGDRKSEEEIARISKLDMKKAKSCELLATHYETLSGRVTNQ
jgi:hypothetical protein